MRRQGRTWRRMLMTMIVVSGVSWAVHTFFRPGARDLARSRPAASSTPETEDLSMPPAEPVQVHLIPRTQPTPLSPTYQTPEP